jgi:hypothetical protein
MARPRPWPFDDEDRPSGSVRPLSQADLQAILVHLTDDEPDQLLAGTGADRPVVAVQVRAGMGPPGGSAHAQWRRARAAEWAAWTRSLPWRVAATLGAAAAGAVLGSLLAPRLALVLGALVAVAVGWGLRFRPSPDAVAWRRGAVGEWRTARLLAGLERQGWVVRRCCVASPQGRLKANLCWIRSPRRVRRMRPPLAGWWAPPPPARSVRAEGSAPRRVRR